MGREKHRNMYLFVAANVTDGPIVAQALSESEDFLMCAQCTSESLGSLNIP